MIPSRLSIFTIKGNIKSTVINLTAWRVATAAPTPYSEPTRLIPLIPPGAAPSSDVIISIFNNLLVHNPIAKPVITKVNVIKIAGSHKVFNSTHEYFVKLVPITVPIPISNIVLVPFSHVVASIFSLMLKILAPIKAPARGAAGMPVFRANAPNVAPAIK